MEEIIRKHQNIINERPVGYIGQIVDVPNYGNIKLIEDWSFCTKAWEWHSKCASTFVMTRRPSEVKLVSQLDHSSLSTPTSYSWSQPILSVPVPKPSGSVQTPSTSYTWSQKEQPLSLLPTPPLHPFPSVVSPSFRAPESFKELCKFLLIGSYKPAFIALNVPNLQTGRDALGQAIAGEINLSSSALENILETMSNYSYIFDIGTFSIMKIGGKTNLYCNFRTHILHVQENGSFVKV